MIAKNAVDRTFVATLNALSGLERQLFDSFATVVDSCRSINLIEAVQVYCVEAEDRAERLGAVAREFGMAIADEAPDFVEELFEHFADYSLVELSADLDALILFGMQRLIYFQLGAYRSMCAILRGRGRREILDQIETSLSEIVYAEEMFAAILDDEINPLEPCDRDLSISEREPIRLSLVSSR